MVRRKTTKLRNIAKVRRVKAKRVNPILTRLIALEDAHFKGAAFVTQRLEELQTQVNDLKVDHGSINPDKLVVDIVKKFKPHILFGLVTGFLFGVTLLVALLK